jgi:hypothetical protein
MTGEPDPHLRRMERRALWIFAIAAAAAAASGGGMRAVAGVAGGALLAAVSYRGIRAGVTTLTDTGAAVSRAGPSTSRTRGLVKFITRFAMLALIAYVMMVRLRAQPVWMLIGASSLVAAAALEVVRTPRARP